MYQTRLATPRDYIMAFDAARPTRTPIFAPPVGRRQPRPQAKIACMSEPFRAHEGVALALGGLSLGALVGALTFVAAGRVEAWIPLTVALAAYVYAIRLVGLSCRDVIATGKLTSIGLFGLHVAALLVWPIVVLLYAPNSWQSWLGLPLALATSSLFFLIARAPASAMYRASGHVCVIAAIGAYQWLWSIMGVAA